MSALEASRHPAAGTAEFIFKFDSIFDCLNISTINSPKALKRAMTTSSSHQSYLQQAINVVKEQKETRKSLA